MATLKKHELVVVCRVKGWKGSESRLPTEFFTKWLAERNVLLAEQFEIVRRFRSGNLGSTGEVRQPSASLTHAEVQDMIANAMPTASESVDESVIAKLVQEAMTAARPHKIILDGADDKKSVELKEHVHPLFEKVLRLVKSGLNVMLVGPAGCGKTTIAEQIARALKRDFGMLSCTAGVSESQLTGWLLPVGDNGKFTFVPAQFTTLYENGNSLFLLDEMDAADSNMLLVINSALANGALNIPQNYKKPHIKRGKDVGILAACNTFGTGTDMLYAGRNQLDAATLDRWYIVRMDYDVALESVLTGRTDSVPSNQKAWKASDAKVTQEAINTMCQWIDKVRAAVAANKMRRVVSTRAYAKAIAALKAGCSAEEIKVDLLNGWTRDEVLKLGV